MATISILLHSGLPCRRAAFPPNVFIFRRIDTELPAEVVQKMQSLPESVKMSIQGKRLKFCTQYEKIINGFDEATITPYLPTAEDVEARDWEFYEEK